MPTIQSLNFRLGDGGATLRGLNNNMNCLNKVRETDHGYGLHLQKIRPYALLLEYSTVQEASRLIVRRASRSTVENVDSGTAGLVTGNW